MNNIEEDLVEAPERQNNLCLTVDPVMAIEEIEVRGFDYVSYRPGKSMSFHPELRDRSLRIDPDDDLVCVSVRSMDALEAVAMYLGIDLTDEHVKRARKSAKEAGVSMVGSRRRQKVNPPTAEQPAAEPAKEAFSVGEEVWIERREPHRDEKIKVKAKIIAVVPPGATGTDVLKNIPEYRKLAHMMTRQNEVMGVASYLAVVFYKDNSTPRLIERCLEAAVERVPSDL